eukprot:CAMPEP_0197569110 /NCGR_PEP_ID=MMETSP1320-20131121/38454_1 /TAXON_ID=91990 /ORGANISM="Bolidomonas sp., Strain RCC2347" /LENGTH=111 /DNA_ID=CAMNT_0043131439 /DNA_START=99 /DNA_END=430 /DNA_ORIENTATION=+
MSTFTDTATAPIAANPTATSAAPQVPMGSVGPQLSAKASRLVESLTSKPLTLERVMAVSKLAFGNAEFKKAAGESELIPMMVQWYLETLATESDEVGSVAAASSSSSAFAG